MPGFRSARRESGVSRPVGSAGGAGRVHPPGAANQPWLHVRLSTGRAFDDMHVLMEEVPIAHTTMRDRAGRRLRIPAGTTAA